MEKWNAYDRNGNLTEYTKTSADVWTSEEYHLGASLWIINNDGDLLIHKRAASKIFGTIVENDDAFILQGKIFIESQ